MKLSLIIPTYNRPRDVMRLLKNLDLQIRKPDEVIIVDASDAEETKMLVEQNREGFAYPVSYYHHEKGLTRQRNFGISKANYEIIGFSDDDALFEPDYFTRILGIFEKDDSRKIGGAAGFIIQIEHSKIHQIDKKLSNISRKEDFSEFMNGCIPSAQEKHQSKERERINKLLLLNSGEEGTFCSKKGRFYFLRDLFRGQKVVDFLQGIAFYRKEIFSFVKYSEYFQGYGFGEDVHFSLQVGKGYNLIVDGEAICYHLHAPGGRPNLFKIGSMYSRNHFYIYKTYKKRHVINYFVFWYFYYLHATLEVLPAFVGKNSIERLKLFFGQIYGGLTCLLVNSE